MVALIALAGCASDSGDAANSPEVSVTAAHGDDDEQLGEADGDEAMAVDVRGMTPGEFYQSNCAACHGANRAGLVGPALTPDAMTQDSQFYVDAIANGVSGTAMPAWLNSGLTMPEIRLLVDFLKTETP
jgi:mono/diheme cytochrome c family protein